MLITAKFDGRCAKCGGPTRKGAEIEYIDKKALHVECAASQRDLLGESEAVELAIRLGFRTAEDLANDGALWPLSTRD